MAQYTCPRCNAPIQAGQRFCASCALPLDQASLQAFYASQQTRPSAPSAPRTKPPKITVYPATKREVKVKEYKDVKEFERDAQKMMRDGWQIEGNTQTEGHVNVGRTATGAVLTGGLSLLFGASRTKGKTTITWIRGGTEAQKECLQCANRVPLAAQICTQCGFAFPPMR